LTLSSLFLTASLISLQDVSRKISAASCCTQPSASQLFLKMEPFIIHLMFSRSHPSFSSILLLLILDAFSARSPFDHAGTGKMLTLAALAFLDAVLTSCYPTLIFFPIFTPFFPLTIG
jgi:hypothetical protein